MSERDAAHGEKIEHILPATHRQRPFTPHRDLDLAYLWVVYPGEKHYNLDEKITAIPAREVATPIAELKNGAILLA